LREENQRTQRKTLRARQESTTNSTLKWHQAGIEPGPHWWKVNAFVYHCTIPTSPFSISSMGLNWAKVMKGLLPYGVINFTQFIFTVWCLTSFTLSFLERLEPQQVQQVNV